MTGPSGHRRRKRWGPPRVCRLLVRVRVADEARLAPGGAYERETHRQPLHGPHGHGDVRITGDRGRRRRASAEEVISVDEVRGPRRTDGRRNECIEMILRERRVDALASCEALRALVRLEVLRVGEAPGGLRIE